MRLGTVRVRRLFARAVPVALIVSVAFAAPARAQDKGVIVFTQQDAVQAFNLETGSGYQVGTAKGFISGTSFVSFQFEPSGPPSADGVLPITFQNQVVITDIDGDQISFENDGSGSFHLGVPPFQGTGGPLRGTYVVTGGTGKYASWKVGTTFTYKAIATNPPLSDALGTVYVEISSRGNGNDNGNKQ